MKLTPFQTRRRLQEEEERLTKLKEKHRTRSEDVVQKAQEVAMLCYIDIYIYASYICLLFHYLLN